MTSFLRLAATVRLASIYMSAVVVSCRGCQLVSDVKLFHSHTLRLRGGGISLSAWMLHPTLDLNETQRTLNKLLWESAERGDVQGINWTLHAGAEINAPGPGLWTALHFAARYGHTDSIKQLIGAGANLESRRFKPIL
jgi:hypothetical protein